MLTRDAHGINPVEPIDEDLAAMTSLPPVLPDMDWHKRTCACRLIHWMVHQTNDYSSG